MLLDPSGRTLGLPQSTLSSLPFKLNDFFLPALWLFFVYGAGFASLTFLLSTNRSRSWHVALVLCMVWLGWITFEMIYIGPSPFIWIWYIPQVAALALLLMPSVRKTFAYR